MIASRLTESILFLETRCASDADREYTDAIRRVIEEHALMRETLECISIEKNIRTISKIASSALRTTAGNTISHDMDIQTMLARLSEVLPSDEQLHEMVAAKALIRKVLGEISQEAPPNPH